jgi:stage II sporulation protein D
MQIGRAAFTVLILCDALAAPHVPISEGNRKMETMQVRVRQEGGRIASMALEDYVAAVLAAESSNFRSGEALKAMAVAARTYAMYFRDRHRGGRFDFCDTTHCQDLRRGRVTPQFVRAAEETAGQLLWFDGSPAATYYHANCGGVTEAAHELWGRHHPYLVRRQDPYCRLAGNPSWESAYSKNLVRKVLAGRGLDAPESLDDVQVTERTSSGRAARLMLIGERVVAVPAAVFRLAMQRSLGWRSLPSESFSVRAAPDKLIFHGRGAGHAVGLCQDGAERMGRAGKSFAEILTHYYPGTVLAR